MVDISVNPLEEPGALCGMVMIIFTDVIIPNVNETINTTVQILGAEMQVSQELFKSSNEKMQSYNEELQSKNNPLRQLGTTHCVSYGVSSLLQS